MNILELGCPDCKTITPFEVTEEDIKLKRKSLTCPKCGHSSPVGLVPANDMEEMIEKIKKITESIPENPGELH